jgi:hypothetical protein
MVATAIVPVVAAATLAALAIIVIVVGSCRPHRRRHGGVRLLFLVMVGRTGAES